MKHLMCAVMFAGSMIGAVAPATADEAQGAVSEVLIKIMTEDGPRWYRVGADISAVDVTEGDVVRFNYEEDTIDAITVVPDCAPAGTESDLPTCPDEGGEQSN